MADFRFRAAAALEIRQKEEQTAAAALARAEAQFSEAQRRVEAATSALARAGDDLVGAMRAGTDVSAVVWHRNWIVRCGADLDGERREASARAAAVRQAEAAWRYARRRRLALERMRERAWRRFQYEAHRQDIKAMDEVARIRHVLGPSGGAYRDD